MFTHAAVTVLSIVSAAAAGGDLTLPLSSSTRPAACRTSAAQVSTPGHETDERSELWDPARLDALDEFCRALARALAALERDPPSSLRAGLELSKTWPGRPEPQVVVARAQTRLGRYNEALQAWELARQRGYTETPDRALRDYAVTLAMLGRAEPALSVYQRLITLSALWPAALERQSLYLEAAFAALRSPKPALAEAASYVARARAEADSTGLRAHAAAVAALIAERQGRPERAPVTLESSEVWRLVELLRAERLPSAWPRVPANEARAAASLLIEPYSAAEAAELWADYALGLDPEQDPGWRKRANERLQRLQAQAGMLP